MNELEKLKAEHAALGERIAKLEAAEPDYSKWVGRLVEASASNGLNWTGPIVFYRYNSGNQYPVVAGVANWKQARLYHGTHKLNMIEHDGSDDCPVSRDQPVIVRNMSGVHAFGFGADMKWRRIDAYCPVDLCHD